MDEYFKISAPFTRIEDIITLKDAGADELYCGYITEELAKKWPLAFNTLNRRGEGQSFEDYEAFKKATDLALDHHLPVYVTINGLYTPEQYTLLHKLVEKVERLKGVKGIIVADLGFLLTLKKNGFRKDIHISTGCTCFNSSTADFFSLLGAKRIVLDRQLTSYEIKSIFKEKKTDIDLAIFIISGGCGGFIDGYCTFFHCFEQQRSEEYIKGRFLSPTYNLGQINKGCDFYFREKIARKDYKIFSTKTHEETDTDLKFQDDKHTLFGCRVCDLYDLRKYPVKSLKIVGRGRDLRYVVNLVKFISTTLGWLKRENISKSEYQQRCKDTFSKMIHNNKKCTDFDCYFSPLWIENEK